MSFLFKSSLPFIQEKKNPGAEARLCTTGSGSFQRGRIYNWFSSCHQGTLMAFYILFVVRAALTETKLKKKKKLTRAPTARTNQLLIFIHALPQLSPARTQNSATGRHHSYRHIARVFWVSCAIVVIMLFNGCRISENEHR